jgi:hypothetical protein
MVEQTWKNDFLGASHQHLMMIAYNLSLEFEPSWVHFVIPSGVGCQAVPLCEGHGARIANFLAIACRCLFPLNFPSISLRRHWFHSTKRHVVATFYLVRPLSSHVLSRQLAIRTKRVVDNK